MTVTPDSFRTTFPEFSDEAKYTDATIGVYIGLATRALNPRVWLDRLDDGILFYSAHLIALNSPVRIVNGVSYYNAPGAIGVTTSKSVGPVSESVDANIGTTEGGGTFNLTRYGQIYLTLKDSVSFGAFQF